MKLIFEPSVYLAGYTYLDPSVIDDWMSDNNIKEEGPISRILDDAQGTFPASVDHIPELAGRFCYRAFNKGRDNRDYLKNILESDHGSVLEHVQLTFIIQGVSRTLTHELVRHRIGVAISQESQRYVDAKDINFVVPPLLVSGILGGENTRAMFEAQCQRQVDEYLQWQELARIAAEAQGYDGTMARKRANEAARWCLPGGAETRLVWSANLRTLRNFLGLRGASAADLEINRLAREIAYLVTDIAPNCFQDLDQDEGGNINLKHGAV